ncbi:MAG: SDR family oxidoreductase [Myxococcales bacterium]|nr:SDR family oxidoreductase [Myxococcales bacterium]
MTTKRNIEGCVAIVTGGATGIGLATVQRLAAEGCHVVIAAHDEALGKLALASLLEAGHDRVTLIKTDIRDEDQVESMVQQTVAQYGRLDLLFNNAGVEGATGPMQGCTKEAVDFVIDTNLKGTFYCMKHAAPIVAEAADGVIINNAPITGTIPMPQQCPTAPARRPLFISHAPSRPPIQRAPCAPTRFALL